MIKISPKNLLGILSAASLWYRRTLQAPYTELIKQQLEEELKVCDETFRQIARTRWDKDAELIIDEAPF